MLKNASADPGIEVLYALLLKDLSSTDWTSGGPGGCSQLTQLCCSPGRRKRAIEPGRDADLVVMAHEPASSGHNFVGWSPYERIEPPFRPVQPSCAGGRSLTAGL